ncbi:MAG TPA: hypothetical protein VFN25_14405 [Dokdonella sp.]|uniref:hypothetical protein n=1 Tax=Dokdonella sp. TaxID=2291710 RepID=UPI002D8090A0|nr:hypothetical protein [Dokdonella sp.]HET9034082.1 hypothetical protein [Dokdonella sp.]
MDITLAKAILSNLRERIEPDTSGRYRLEGIITQRELEALDALLAEVSVESSATKPKAPAASSPVTPEPQSLLAAPPSKPIVEPSIDIEVPLDLTAVTLPECATSFRVCLDFGTAMSKATFVSDNEDTNFEDIKVLRLGIPGDQEEIDEFMLISSLFIDAQGLIWFGKKAMEHAHATSDGSTTRLDNIKRWLSEGNLSTPVESIHNPTTHNITYEDLVLAYLAFFTWAVNAALSEDIVEATVPRNFPRRFAMPCFPRPNAEQVRLKLMSLLGEAQIIADTLKDEIHEGLPLGRFLAAVKQLRASKRSYPFIEGSITEPLGVAGSLLSWRSRHDSLALVVDIGAGTSDFSLYRLLVSIDDDGEVDSAKTTAMEVDNSARGITEAGNHLDHLLKAFILGQAGITAAHPQFTNIAYHLERDIRDHKETLFNTGSVFIVLYNDETVEVSLDEFLAHDAVKGFEESLRDTLVEVLEAVDPEFINWVRVNASRNLVIVLTGGGAGLPMARKLAAEAVLVNGSPVAVAAAQSFPAWLQKDYPDLEEYYPRVAVSLGGARKNVIRSKGVAKTTASGLGGHVLDRF